MSSSCKAQKTATVLSHHKITINNMVSYCFTLSTMINLTRKKSTGYVTIILYFYNIMSVKRPKVN